MRRHHRLLLTSLAALALLAAASAAPASRAAYAALVGPPWISIEYPGNPFDREHRDAFLYVHTFHHNSAVDAGVVGRAEGIVAGSRRTVQLQFAKTSRAGTYALKRQWPTDGTWMLVISTRPTSAGDYGATALVELDASGEVSSVRVPSTVQRDGWRVPTRVSAEQVDAALRARASRVAAAGR